MIARVLLILLLMLAASIPAHAGITDVDIYGGWTDYPVSTNLAGTAGFFRTGTVNGHAVFVTPDSNNAFWMRGLYNVIPPGNVISKYGTVANWANIQNARSKLWGFNANVEYWSAAICGNPAVTTKLPCSVLLRPSYYGLFNNPINGVTVITDAIKDVTAGVKATWAGGTFDGYTGNTLPDVYDANYKIYAGAMFADPYYSGPLTGADKKYVVAVVMDEVDSMRGYAGGGTFPPIVNGVSVPYSADNSRFQPHLGWTSLVMSPIQAGNQQYNLAYLDREVKTKTALAAQLSTTYGGNIAALNTAWDANVVTSYDFAFNFRQSCGNATDNAYAVCANTEAPGHVYTNLNGTSVTGGWSANVPTGQMLSFGGNAVQIDGAVYQFNGSPFGGISTFAFTLPSTGDYEIDFAAGEKFSSGRQFIKVKAGGTTLIDCTNGTTGYVTAAGHYIDATCTDKTASTTWNGTMVTKTLASTSVTVEIAAPNGTAAGRTAFNFIRFRKLPVTTAGFYTTFGTTATERSATIFTGDGVTKTFSGTLPNTPVTPFSARIKINGTVVAGHASSKASWVPADHFYGAAVDKLHMLSIRYTGSGSAASLTVGDNPSNNNAFTLMTTVTGAAGDNLSVVLNAGQGNVYATIDALVSAINALGKPYTVAAVQGPSAVAINYQTITNIKPAVSFVTGGPPETESAFNLTTGAWSVTFKTAPANAAAGTMEWQTGGWGVGTGILDVNGRNTWIGSDWNTMPAQTAAMRADLDAFLLAHATRYFADMKSVVNTQAPGFLYQATTYTGGWASPARCGILQAAGTYADILALSAIPAGVNAADDQARIDHIVTCGLGKPVVMWQGLIANPDSSQSAYTPPDTPPGQFATQALRGAYYVSNVAAMIAAKHSSGSACVIAGIRDWELRDNARELANWGLVSLLDNAYDGTQAKIATSTDSFGIARGGESANYGNFITSVIAGNALAYTALATSCGPAAPSTGTVTVPGGITIRGTVTVP